jgi:ArsR family transcriptional regulator
MAISERERKRYEARAKVAKALAHPSRLYLLDLLRTGECCVGDLTEKVGADQSTVSKHLALLKEAGLVTVRKEGAMSYFRVCCDCLGDFFCCLESVVRADVADRKSALK